MFRWIQRFGLKRNLYVSFPLALIVVLAALSLTVSSLVRGALEHALLRRGESMSRSLERTMRLPLLKGQERAVLDELQSLDGEDIAYVIVQRPSGAVLAQRYGKDFERERDFAGIVSRHAG